MARGLFITTEGTDGSGKSTQIRLIQQYLENKGYKVVLSREPGGTNISEKIRDIILDIDNTEMSETTEMLLYAASRAQHVSQIIKSAVMEGKMVICDRFVDSSFVYQGFGRGIDFSTIEKVNNVALDGMSPDITFFFDISPVVALERRISTTGADRIEQEKMDFHMRVYEGYKKLSQMYPDRIRSIDSNRTIEEIFEDVKKILEKHLK